MCTQSRDATRLQGVSPHGPMGHSVYTPRASYRWSASHSVSAHLSQQLRSILPAVSTMMDRTKEYMQPHRHCYLNHNHGQEVGTSGSLNKACGCNENHPLPWLEAVSLVGLPAGPWVQDQGSLQGHCCLGEGGSEVLGPRSDSTSASPQAAGDAAGRPLPLSLLDHFHPCLPSL